MLVAGISATSEMCVTLDGSVLLEPCLGAIAVGDGRELWAFQAGGQLMHLTSKECVGRRSPTAGADIVTMPCDSADAWELLANGQMRVGPLCLSQSGSMAGEENAAAHAAAMSTSTADASAHGAAAVVDLSEASYWASKSDGVDQVELSIDLGLKRRLESMRVVWESPAKAFAVLVSEDGEHWSEVYATSVNVESLTTIPLAGRWASKVRLAMQEPHPGKHAPYAVRSVSIRAPRLRAVAEDCTAAGRKTDVRDKYFATFVSEFDPALSKPLVAELPSLASAKAGLSAAVCEIIDSIPKASQCASASFAARARETVARVGDTLLVESSDSRSRGWTEAGSDNMARAVAHAVDTQYGAGAGSMKHILQSARSAIVRLRSLLQ